MELLEKPWTFKKKKKNDRYILACEFYDPYIPKFIE